MRRTGQGATGSNQIKAKVTAPHFAMFFPAWRQGLYRLERRDVTSLVAKILAFHFSA
jgi:uncharacterized membrane protein YfbV (UPF0208 family)